MLRFGLPGQPLFPALSGDSILKPTLSWLLQTNDPGKFDAEISYVAGGMSWQADYNLVVSDNPKGKTDLLDMVGWITMRNQSGKMFENASIKLMAGDVNKLQPASLATRAYGAMNKAMADEAMAPIVREKSFDESIRGGDFSFKPLIEFADVAPWLPGREIENLSERLAELSRKPFRLDRLRG